jgi:hypothetical protein
MQTPQPGCAWLVIDNANRSLLSAKIKSLGWEEVAAIKRPTDKVETLVIFRPATTPSTPSDPSAR